MPYELEKLVYTTRGGCRKNKKAFSIEGASFIFGAGQKSDLSLSRAFGDGPELQKRHGLAVLFCKELLHYANKFLRTF